jgi:hypothetical protein
VQQLPADEPQSPGPFISNPSALSPPLGSVASPHLRYDDPRAIHQRYVASRNAWYKTQPPGTFLSNRQYRKAMGLPLGYPTSSYTWCMDYKQMGRCCITPAGSREWTKEELMAYLDWDKLETDRIEARVAQEAEGGRLLTKAWGIYGRWRSTISTNRRPRTMLRGMKDAASWFSSSIDWPSLVQYFWL